MGGTSSVWRRDRRLKSYFRGFLLSNSPRYYGHYTHTQRPLWTLSPSLYVHRTSVREVTIPAVPCVNAEHTKANLRGSQASQGDVQPLPRSEVILSSTFSTSLWPLL